MYTFVFLWTPALSPNDEEIPHGFVFAIFMLSSMIGSSLASRFMARSSLRVEVYMQVVFLISAATLLSPVVINVSQFSENAVNFVNTCIHMKRFLYPFASTIKSMGVINLFRDLKGSTYEGIGNIELYIGMKGKCII